MIPRTLQAYLRGASAYFPVVACVGPRQSGKTTLARATFEELPYVSLENLDTREFALSDPRGFLATYSGGAIFDEVQRAPSLLSYLQGVVDEAADGGGGANTRRAGRYVLTGSHNFLLREAISQTLAGRVALTTLLPFSLEEVPPRAEQTYEHVLWNGAYPRILADGVPANEWLPNYIATYIERDVRQIQAVSDLAQFTLFVRMCAGRTGQIINLTAMANECGISANTAKAWLNLLEASYILFRLPAYHQNFNKRLIKAPKLYFYDAGLACSLLGIQSPEQVQSHFARGALFETMVIADVKKWFFHRGRQAHISFWRDSNGKEIDCIIETSSPNDPPRRIALEIKSGRTLGGDMFDSLRSWQSLSGDAPENSFLVYGGDENQRRSVAGVLSWRGAIAQILGAA
jgi:predicted AAA+ superfamily ATPase